MGIFHSMFPRLTSLLLVLMPALVLHAQTDDQTVTARIVADETSQALSQATVQGYITALGATGTWADVNYADTSITEWNPATHTARLLEMARAYQRPTHALYRDAALSNAIHQALKAFTSINPQSSNWWYNEIDSPRKISRTLLLLGSEASTAEVASAMTILNRSSLTGVTGQNLMWEAGNVLVKGLIVNSNAVVSNAAKAITGLYVVTADEGVQFDYSFHQHGPQLYTGGYGAGFGDDGAMWQDTLRGTAWAASTSQVDALTRYLLDGVRWEIWGKAWDFGVIGRGISRGVPGASGMADAFLRMTNLAPAQAVDLRAFSLGLSSTGVFGGVLSGQRHYWSSDQTIHRRTNWSCSIRGCSTRVQGTETGNGEGLADYYLGDGLTLFQRDGGEYNRIPPVWNWRRLPGVTCPQTSGALPVLGWSGYMGGHSFVGGVCDGTNGAMTMTQIRDGLTLRKSWFAHGDAVLCLGAGLSYTNSTNVVATTINQCLWRTTAVLRTTSSTQQLAVGSYILTNALWLHHDGIGYLPLGAGSGVFRLSLQPQTGTWVSINTAGDIPPVTSSVFTLWADHGVKPSNGSYAYAVLPMATTSTMPALAAAPPFGILNNSTQAQAAYFAAPSVLQAVFHGATSVTSPAGTRIAAEARCMVMATLLSNAVTLCVSRPDHATGVLTVRINRALSGPGATWLSASRETRLALNVPQGNYAGSTTTYLFTAVAEVAPAVTSDYGADAWLERAQLHGELTAGEPADVALLWDRTDRGTNRTAWTNTVVLPGRSNGRFAAFVTGFAPGSTYVYRCYASNSVGTAWSSSRAFRTASRRDPSAFSGLRLWLDAGDLTANGAVHTNTEPVGTWSDKSGLGRHASGGASVTSQPRLILNALNGRPVVQFDGNDYLDAGAAAVHDNTTGMTIFVVCRTPAVSNIAVLSKDTWTGNQREWVVHSGDYQVQQLTNVFNAANQVSFQVVSNAQLLAGHWRPGVRNELFRDGETLGTSAAAAAYMSASSAKLLVGAVNNLDASRFLTGDIAEIAIYARALDTNDLHGLGASLALKYGLDYAETSPQPDADADGLPDDYERSITGGVATLGGATDTDGDRMSDVAEWIAGTSPLSTASVFVCSDLAMASNAQVRIVWPSATGRTYRIEYALSPGSPYGTVRSNMVATPPQNIATVSVGQAAGVFRVLAAP